MHLYLVTLFVCGSKVATPKSFSLQLFSARIFGLLICFCWGDWLLILMLKPPHSCQMWTKYVPPEHRECNGNGKKYYYSWGVAYWIHFMGLNNLTCWCLLHLFINSIHGYHYCYKHTLHALLLSFQNFNIEIYHLFTHARELCCEVWEWSLCLSLGSVSSGSVVTALGYFWSIIDWAVADLG